VPKLYPPETTHPAVWAGNNQIEWFNRDNQPCQPGECGGKKTEAAEQGSDNPVYVRNSLTRKRTCSNLFFRHVAVRLSTNNEQYTLWLNAFLQEVGG
jgi:hypothetical protein